jgi:MFS family permease
LRRARLGAAIAFLLTGLVFSTWAARIPALKAELGLTDGQLAVAFLGLNAGAVLGLQLGAVVVIRLGSRGALLVGLPVFAGLLLPIAYAPNLPVLTVAVGVSAAANSVVDVAMNDQGVGIQHGYGRSLLAGLHAMHSLGGVLGGVTAAAVAHLGLGVEGHFALVAAVGVVAALLANPTLLAPDRLHGDEAESARSAPLLAGWTGRLLLLGAVAFVFTLVEGSALDWTAVLLADHRGAGPALAAAGLAVFQGAVTLGRLFGDSFVDRVGPACVFAAGAVLAGSGMATGLLLGTTATAVVGLALLGLGLATLMPISLSAAGASSGLPVPVAVARVSTLGYLGSFTGPALIGYLAHHASLPTALLVPALAVALTALAAPAVRRNARVAP